MFDNCITVARNLTPKEAVSVGHSEAFADSDGEEDKFGWIRAKHRGQNLMFSPARAELRVQGSLATFAKGHNLHLLTYSELQLACPALAAAVGLPMARLRLVRLELSLDMDSTTSPQPFLQSLQHHKHRKFCMVLPRNSTSCPLEYVAVHAEYNAKLYDKNKWAKQLGLPVLAGQHKLRYEIVMKQARPINALLNRSVITLADLFSPEFYAAAAAKLEQRWKEIVRDKPLDYNGLSRKDRDLLATRGSKDHWSALKAVVAPITVKRHKRRYAELVEAMTKRIAPNEYDQRFPSALAALLPPVATTQNDTFLHTYSLLELPPAKEPAAAPPLVKDAGSLAGLAADDEATTTPARWPDLTNRNSSPGPHDDDSQHDDDHEETGARRWPHIPILYTSSSPPCLSVTDDDERESTTTAARRCLTCGAPLASHRKPETRYCGKKCKNAASNPGHNARRTLHKIESQPLLFPIREFVRVPEQIRAFVLAAVA